MKNPCSLSTIGRWAILAAMPAALYLTASPAAAQDEVLAELLPRVNVVQEDGRRIIEVDLATTLSLAMERSISLASSRLGMDIAQSDLVAALNRNHPTLTNSVGFGHSITNLGPLGSEFTSLSGTDGLTLSIGAEKQTSSGISYGLTYSELRSRSRTLSISEAGEAPTVGSFGDWVDAAALTGTIDIPLFQDFGSEINDIPVRRGEVGVTRSRYLTRDQELAVLENIAKSYWRLVGLQEGLRVREKAVALSEQLVKDNQARLRAGVLSPADVQASETQLARERANRLDAELNIVILVDQLRAALNLPSLEGYGFRPVDAPRVGDVARDYAPLWRKVQENYPQLGVLQTQLADNRYSLALARNQDAPNLDLSLKYVLNGYSSDPLGSTAGFAESDLQGYSAALTWTVPLWDQATAETIRKRQLEQKQLELQIRDTESVLAVRLQTVLRSLELAVENARAAQVAKALAQAQLANGVDRFRLGRTTSFEVSQLQQAALEAEEREILSRIQYETSQIDLLILTGDIYSRYHLQSTADARGNGYRENQ